MSEAFRVVDIHSHLLPGRDDGPQTMDDSVRMCAQYVAQGVAAVVATPHMGDPRFQVTPDAVRRGVEELRAACAERGLGLTILPGGDVRLEPELLATLDRGEVLTVADTGKYLLLELPAQTVPRCEGLIFELSVRGITPIVSHPERNVELWRKPHRLAELVDRGCLVQLTADSLSGRFGLEAQRTAERFLKEGLVHVVASDAHSPGRRRPQFEVARQRLASLVGKQGMRRLLEGNPARIVRGEALDVAVSGGGAGPEQDEGSRPGSWTT
jgi:protein-tyrosine phosphatase